MNKKEFTEQLNKSLDNVSLENAKKIINEIGDKLPSNLYDVTLCIINNINGNLSLSDEEIDNKINYIKDMFKEIEEGNICSRCYSYEDGYYGCYGENYDYHYYPTKEMDNILNETYEFGKKLVYYKKYSKAIEMFDLILYSKYTCEEVGNPEYDDSDEVYDYFDVDLETVKHNLDFDIDYVYLYAIYAVLAGNYADKNEKIYKYLKENNHVMIEGALCLGIEEIKELDKFYSDWIKYLKDKSDDKAKRLLENALTKIDSK